MIRRLARYRVKKDQLAGAIDAIRAFIRAIGQHEPGTFRYESYRDADGTGFTHLMEFRDSTAEEQHRRSPHVQAFVNALHTRCEQPPVLTEVELVASVGAQGLPVRNVRHVEEFDAAPEVIYDALMRADQHAAFTRFDAHIDATEGGQFRTCGERNFGFNLELAPGRRIVQAWRHRDWPTYHWSIASFEIRPRPGGGTRLHFTQVGVPAEAWGWIDEGWRSTYWDALRKWLAEEAPATRRM